MVSEPHRRSSWISRSPWRPVDVFRPLALVLVGLILFAVWGWLRSADSRALASMDPDLRGELFRRSRAEADALCARPELEEECRSRLTFLEQFPECDASCRAFVAAHRRPPTR
jgi:hypothetical protein